MAKPEHVKLKHQIRELEMEEFSLDEFWEAIDALPDELDGKDYKKIIKIIYKSDGEPDFDDMEKLQQKLAKKSEHEAFQEWNDANRLIKKVVRHKMRTIRHRKAINERKQKIRSGEHVAGIRARRES